MVRGDPGDGKGRIASFKPLTAPKHSPKDPLDPTHRRLRQRTSMVATLAFPSPPAPPTDRPEVGVAWVRFPLGIAMNLDHGILPRRDHRDRPAPGHRLIDTLL